MLEKLGQPGYTRITKPDWEAVQHLDAIIVAGNEAPVIAELGVGIGATTIQFATRMANKGSIHIFDFAESVEELRRDLADRGFINVIPHGNTGRHWDSYHWSLAKMLDEEKPDTTFDLIYIDGAHTYLHDALAFFMCDRLLKVGGLMLFDDYEWSFSGSKYLTGKRHEYMTSEQEESKQIKRFVDQLVKTSIHYEETMPNKGFRKLSSSVKR